MEKYEAVPQEDPTRPSGTAPAPSEAPAPAAPDLLDTERQAPAEAVTPYDHLWFERRPLS